jgi:hypothetical protein
MMLSQKLVAGYLLKELSIDPQGSYENSISALRSPENQLIDSSGRMDYLYLYGLTHIIITKSGYFGRYLDPNEFELEISIFRKALNKFTSAPGMTDFEADILAEILICLKLLPLPSDPQVEIVCRRLVERQNPDGSWGKGQKISTSKVHHTVVSTLALMEFAPTLQAESIFCDVKHPR